MSENTEPEEGLSPFPTHVFRNNTNTLLALTDDQPEAETHTCRHLYSSYSDTEVHLVVATDKDVHQTEDWCAELFESFPSTLDIVSTDIRSNDQTHFTDGTITTVKQYNATEFGLELSTLIEDSKTDQLTVLCFQSLTDFLRINDPEVTFRFLHILGQKIDQNDGQAHYHIDPSKVENKVLETLINVLDAAVTYDGESWRIA
jgi:hypothetical protein